MQNELGKKVSVAATMRRREFSKFNEFGHKQRRKEWQRFPVSQPVEGIIIGIRTLSNGYTDYLSEYGYVYYPETYLKAYLVVTDIHKKPITVPVESAHAL